MKSKVTNVKRLLSITLLLFTVGGLVMSTPSAFAMSPVPTFAPSPAVQGETVTIKIESKGGGISPHQGVEISVYEPGSTSDNNGGNNACPNNGVTSGTVWNLVAVGTTTKIGYLIPAGSNGEHFLTVDFGTGGTVSVDPSPSTKIFIGVNGADAGVSVAAEWHDGTNPNTDSTDTIGNYGHETCGTETENFSSPYRTPDVFIVQLPVGGTIIPIDMTALLIVGAYSSVSWMLPVLGAVAGIGFALYKFQPKRKQE